MKSNLLTAGVAGLLAMCFSAPALAEDIYLSCQLDSSKYESICKKENLCRETFLLRIRRDGGGQLIDLGYYKGQGTVALCPYPWPNRPHSRCTLQITAEAYTFSQLDPTGGLDTYKFDRQTGEEEDTEYTNDKGIRVLDRGACTPSPTDPSPPAPATRF